MYQVTKQELHKIEIALSDELTLNEFKEVIHQLESLCTSQPNINVLFDAREVKSYDFKILLEEYDFYKEYKSYLKNVAVVSDRKFERFILEKFNNYTDTEFRAFAPEQIEEARNWIFPSRLPG